MVLCVLILKDSRKSIEVSGSVLDEDGQPLDSVAVDYHACTPSVLGDRERKTFSKIVTVSRAFDFKVVGYDSLQINFAKDGFRPARLDCLDEGVFKKDVILRRMPTTSSNAAIEMDQFRVGITP